MATRKTKTNADTGVKANITIAEADADVKQKETHKRNMGKVAKKKGDDLPQGKELNHKTYEFACDDCLADAIANGDVYCLYEETLNEVGRCKCGKYTTHKAILL